MQDPPQNSSLKISESKYKTRLSAHLEELCRDGRVPGSSHYQNIQAYLKDQIQASGLAPQEQSFWHLPKGRCLNIYAETGPPTAPTSLIGAHYDSLKRSGEAADDNASAVAVVLELMKNLPRDHSFVFAFFDVEENYGFGALKGSKAFCHFYPRPLEQVMILDLVGGTFCPGLENAYFQFGEANETLHHPPLEFYHLPIPFLEPLGKCGARSDYDSFRRKKIPFTFLSTGTPWYYHTLNDTRDKISLDKMVLLTKVLVERYTQFRSRRGLASWSNLNPLLEKFKRQEELNLEIIQKLVSHKHPPSHWELIQLHYHILKKIRRLGPDLWN